MNLSIVIRSLSDNVTGGAQIAAENLARELVNSGHQVTVITKRFSRTKTASQRNYSVKYLFSLPKDLLQELTLFVSLFVKFLLNKYDAVLAVNLYPTGYICTKLKRLMNLNLVLRPIGIDVQIDQEMGYGLRLNHRLDKKIKYTLKNCSYMIVTSEMMKREVISLGTPSESVHVIPNGVSIKKYQDVLPLKREAPYILTLARLEKKKGIDILIKAFEKLSLNKKCPDLVIAGDGPERKALENLTTDLSLSDKIRFLGNVIGKEKLELFSGCDFFVCPSRYEPFGITNLEAMAAGKAVIAANVDGIPEVVMDGYNGLLFEAGNHKSLLEKLQEITQKNDLKKRLENGARKFIKNYNWDIIAERYLRVIELAANKVVREK